MTTVRELITKWVFQADTSAVKAFEGAITAAKNSAKLAAGAIAGITAVSVKTGDALFKLTESIAEQSHEVNRSAAISGLSKHKDLLQQLRFVASKTNVDFGLLVRGMRQFNIAAQNASHGSKTQQKAFHELFKGTELLNGKMRPTNELLEESITRLADMKDEGLKATLMQKLFARGSMAWMPLLEKSSDELVELMVAARESNRVLSDSDLAKGQKMNEGLRALRNTADGFKTQLGVALMPAVSEVVGEINEWVKANKGLVSQKIHEIAARIADALREMVQAAKEHDILGALSETLKGLAAAMSWVLKHGTLVKWLFISLMGLALVSKLTPALMLFGKLAGVFAKIAKLGPSVATAMAGGGAGGAGVGMAGKLGTLGTLGMAGAAAGVGYAAGTWLDEKTGASDWISDKLASLHRDSKGTIDKRAGAGSLATQAKMFADLMRRGVKSVQLAEGGTMALTRENIAGRLSMQASKLDIGGKEEQGKAIADALSAAGITQTNNVNVTVTIPPGTPAEVGKKTGEEIRDNAVKQIRHALKVGR